MAGFERRSFEPFLHLADDEIGQLVDAFRFDPLGIGFIIAGERLQLFFDFGIPQEAFVEARRAHDLNARFQGNFLYRLDVPAVIDRRRIHDRASAVLFEIKNVPLGFLFIVQQQIVLSPFLPEGRTAYNMFVGIRKAQILFGDVSM